MNLRTPAKQQLWSVRPLIKRLLFVAGVAGVAGIVVSGALTAAELTTHRLGNYQRLPAKSGYEFQTPGLRAMQDDNFANPGYLWVDKGQALWTQTVGNVGSVSNAGPSCASCHGARGEVPINGSALTVNDAATRYPRFQSGVGSLVNLEQQINACRKRYQKLPGLAWESDELLSITAFVGELARGKPVKVQIDGPAKRYFDEGRHYYQTRRGQLNLACTQCHDQNVGRQLRGDTVTQGQSNGFPAYRLQWQKPGSLHRRLRNCNVGVRAEPLPYGSATYLSLELFLAWRASGLPIETPAVRP